MSIKVKYFFTMLKKHRNGLIGLVMMTIVIVLGILAPVIAPFDPEMVNAADARMAPSALHLFGTDETGMDVFSRCLYAIRIDVVIGVLGTFLSLLIGIPIGLLAGYREGFVGEIILRMADLIQAFPSFILAMALVASPVL